MAIQLQRGAPALTPIVHDSNLGVIAGAVNQATDTGWLSSTEAFPANGASLASFLDPYLILPESGTAAWTLRPSPAWNHHQLTLRTVYRNGTASAAAFSITWLVQAVIVGQPGYTAIGTATVSVPGLAGAGGPVGAFEVTLSSSPIIPTMEYLGINLSRAASDAEGANALQVLGVQWRAYHL